MLFRSLKENVIIGKLIPAGTGMKRYRNIKLDSDVDENAEIAFDDDFELDVDIDISDERQEETIEEELAETIEE